MVFFPPSKAGARWISLGALHSTPKPRSDHRARHILNAFGPNAKQAGTSKKGILKKGEGSGKVGKGAKSARGKASKKGETGEVNGGKRSSKDDSPPQKLSFGEAAKLGPGSTRGQGYADHSVRDEMIHLPAVQS
jgi:hypothetical protein